MCEIRGDFAEAKKLAEDTVIEASSLENNLNHSAITMLQKLRDDYMTISLEEFNKLIAVYPLHGISVVVNDEGEVVVDAERSASPVDKNRLGATSPFPQDTAIFSLAGNRADMPVDTTNLFSGNVQTIPQIPNYQIIRRIRCNVSLDFPIRMENMASAVDIVPALDYIFRGYCRGNSLPGTQFGSKDVVLGDSKMSMGKFLLQVS